MADLVFTPEEIAAVEAGIAWIAEDPAGRWWDGRPSHDGNGHGNRCCLFVAAKRHGPRAGFGLYHGQAIFTANDTAPDFATACERVRKLMRGERG